MSTSSCHSKEVAANGLCGFNPLVHLAEQLLLSAAAIRNLTLSSARGSESISADFSAPGTAMGRQSELSLPRTKAGGGVDTSPGVAPYRDSKVGGTGPPEAL